MLLHRSHASKQHLSVYRGAGLLEQAQFSKRSQAILAAIQPIGQGASLSDHRAVV